MAVRIGVDIGGTFTDLVCLDDASGELRVAKVPTTPGRPEEGCRAALEQAGLNTLLGECAYFLHGTTVGLNALLERRGAVVGLLCTDGFRDILEIRRGDRDRYYDLTWVPPAPLVPRRLRLGVRERTGSDGKVLNTVEVADVAAALETFKEAGVDSVAVVYLNAYANGANEAETERLLRSLGFDGSISLSHRISGEYREYERTSTTVIDAFVRARMSDYLGRLEGHLRGAGFCGATLITRSGGGAMTFAEAGERPFETIMSGPVAGSEGAAELSRAANLGDLITADVGGTSFDTSLILGGRSQLLYEGSIIDLPVQGAWVDVRSIGAGGGSLARIDSGGLLRVGPESAGAVPGPACYGRGGVEPTLTDAAFLLGMLGSGELASGLVLDRRLAEDAMRRVAEPLGFDLQRAARGIVRIATSHMANAIREITVERGVDQRSLSLLAIGGAGPMMASELARELGVRRVILPPHAGNFSAWGLLGADLLQSGARTRLVRLSGTAIEDVNAVLAELFDELRSRETQVAGTEASIPEVLLDIRFEGQEHALTVTPPSAGGRVTATAAELRTLFETEYRRTFATHFTGEAEITAVRATLRRVLPRRATAAPPARPAAPRSLEAHSFAADRVMSFGLIPRTALAKQERRQGPLIVTEQTCTTYVDADFAVEIDAHGCMHLLHTGELQ